MDFYEVPPNLLPHGEYEARLEADAKAEKALREEILASMGIEPVTPYETPRPRPRLKVKVPEAPKRVKPNTHPEPVIRPWPKNKKRPVSAARPGETTRQTARRLGRKTYLSPRPCLRDHVGPRHVVNGTCLECVAVREAADPDRTRTLWRERKRRQYARDREREELRREQRREKAREWRERKKARLVANRSQD